MNIKKLYRPFPDSYLQRNATTWARNRILLGVMAVGIMNFAPTLAAVGQEDPVDRSSGYRNPADNVTALLTAPTPPEPLLHMSSGRIALMYREPLIPLERVSQSRLGLGGFKFEAVSGTSGLYPLIRKIGIVSAKNLAAAPLIWIPADNSVLDFVRFSPDGNRVYLWLAFNAPFDGKPVEIASSKKLIHRFGWAASPQPFR